MCLWCNKPTAALPPSVPPTVPLGSELGHRRWVGDRCFFSRVDMFVWFAFYRIGSKCIIGVCCYTRVLFVVSVENKWLPFAHNGFLQIHSAITHATDSIFEMGLCNHFYFGSISGHGSFLLRLLKSGAEP